jgi:hypothetical protein
MLHFDLCLAWNWDYDRDFVSLLAEACVRLDLAFLSVDSDNLESVMTGLSGREISFSTFLDRASDSDPRFQRLADEACQESVYQVNPREFAAWSADKATMHLEFISRGLDTPYTILLPPYNEQTWLPPIDLAPLGGRFAIKPGSLGGGEGVLLEGVSLEQVQSARQQYPKEKYLLQTQVIPKVLDGRRAWFRLLVCDGAVYPCWWDPGTHAYGRVTADERFRYGLRSLNEVARRISQICRLDLFSTEVAMASNGSLLAVDYVNDPLDLRLQSTAADGVPDEIVENIAGRLARLAQRHRSNLSNEST